MEKIISLFKRNYETDHMVRDDVVPGAEWVLAGDGIATRKFDGTCCAIIGGELWKRYDAKRGKMPPDGWIAAQEPDPITGHHPGWLKVKYEPDSVYHLEAFTKGVDSDGKPLRDGTYELCGPKMQGNPEGFTNHVLVRHGEEVLPTCPRDFDGIKDFLETAGIEGIVWHHPDGRMVKIKRKDFFKQAK